MIHGPPFPSTIEELDRATLSLALKADVDSFTLERIGADRGMLGEIFLVRPKYAPGATGPNQVIAKFAAMREGALASAQRGGNHERELRCYDELLAASAVSTPHFYHAWYDPDTAHFLLVQEAVAADGDIDQVEGVDRDLAALVAGEAAKLHHERWADPALTDLGWLPRLDDPRRVNNLTTMASIGWQPLCDLLGDSLTSSERELGHTFPERVESALRSLATMVPTFIHSDLRTDNLLFAVDHQSVALIDWQGAGVGPGSFDIAYLLSQSLTVTDRRRHEADLINRYLHDLATAGTTQSLDDFMAGYRLALLYGLVVACALPMIADRGQARVEKLAHAMARRSIEALRDHDQLWT